MKDSTAAHTTNTAIRREVEGREAALVEAVEAVFVDGSDSLYQTKMVYKY